MTEPCASSTARLTMFSEAISSISCRCRPSSPWIAAAISGSACARLAVKKESGALAVLALEDGGFIAKYLHRRNPLGGAVGLVVAVGSGGQPISTLTGGG